VVEDPLDHWRFEDGGNDLELAAAVRAVLEVDLEDALERPGPTAARRPAVCAAWLSGDELRRAGTPRSDVTPVASAASTIDQAASFRIATWARLVLKASGGITNTLRPADLSYEDLPGPLETAHIAVAQPGVDRKQDHPLLKRR